VGIASGAKGRALAMTGRLVNGECNSPEGEITSCCNLENL
jgi:hypothetical protein